MSKRTSPQEILDNIEWVRLLPDSAWSHGICSTADSLVDEISELERERKILNEKIRSRLKVLRLIPSRAEREANLMHEKEDVEAAKKSVDQIKG